MRAALLALALLLLPGAALLRVEGAGPAVVLEAGQGRGPADWDAVATRLSRCLRVVRHDRAAGYPPGDAPVLAADVSARLGAALDAAGIAGPVILAAHSLGGLYAQDFARRFPARVKGLVLVDAASPLEPPGVFVSTQPFAPGSAEAREEAGVAPSVAAILAGPPLPPVPLRVLAATDHGDTPEREALWRRVQRETAALSPRGRLQVVRGGHDLHREAPGAVAGAILAVAGVACPR